MCLAITQSEFLTFKAYYMSCRVVIPGKRILIIWAWYSSITHNPVLYVECPNATIVTLHVSCHHSHTSLNQSFCFQPPKAWHVLGHYFL